MELKYRVLGKVNNAFILRGLHFASGIGIDFSVTESELAFVRERCEIVEVKELKSNVPNQSPTIPKAEKESRNDKPRANQNTRSESKGSTKVSVVAR